MWGESTEGAEEEKEIVESGGKGSNEEVDIPEVVAMKDVRKQPIEWRE